MTETLKDLQQKFGAASDSLTRAEVDAVAVLADKPKLWQWSGSGANVSKTRRWLQHYLNLSSTELDRMLLGHFVRAHADEMTSGEVPVRRVVGRVP